MVEDWFTAEEVHDSRMRGAYVILKRRCRKNDCHRVLRPQLVKSLSAWTKSRIASLTATAHALQPPAPLGATQGQHSVQHATGGSRDATEPHR